ncbi:uncharacterized protein J3D65DRAFT_617806 [Phyllosticta citribraziliensis]|uniref:Transmembrane protein n=1 Tax=Phyllosticta citribraziliensis TaxID=989973 RepID=A0ABR1M155_9PEZI
MVGGASSLNDFSTLDIDIVAIDVATSFVVFFFFVGVGSGKALCCKTRRQSKSRDVYRRVECLHVVVEFRYIAWSCFVFVVLLFRPDVFLLNGFHRRAYTSFPLLPDRR